MTKLQNLVYISGSGRSGSTLLERILHSAEGVAALGEFHCLWRLPESQITCSCGSPFRHDGFWSAILRAAELDGGALDELRRLEALVCRTGFIARHGFSLDSLRDDSDVQRFLDLQFRLFTAVAAVSGNGILVDSSKAGPRAWILACDSRVRIVHLYRDPADVIVSWRSSKYDPGLGRAMKRMPIRTAALDWWKVEQLIQRLPRQVPVGRVDYRRLCSAPQAALEGLLDRLKLRSRVQPAWTGANSVEPGQDYHSLNGNPDRFDRAVITIAPRDAAWHKVRASERPAIWLAAAALRALHRGGA